MSQTKYNPIPLILFLLVLGGFGAWVVLKDRKPKEPPPPPPDPKAVSYCFLDDVTIENGGATAKIVLDNQEFQRVDRSGTFTFVVRHTEPPDPDPAKRFGVAKKADDVCSFEAQVAEASFVDHAVTVKGTFNKACPPSSPADRIVEITGHFAVSDTHSASCEYGGKVPASIGGNDQTKDEQAQHCFRRKAEQEKPEEFATVQRFFASLAKGTARIDPLRRPAATFCPPSVKGRGSIIAYPTIRIALSPMDAGLPSADAQAMSTDWVSESPLGPLLVGAYWGSADRVAAIAAELARMGSYVIVVTTLASVAPETHTPERMAGQSVVEGTYTPGSFEGALFVIDGHEGTLLCATSIEATGASSKLEGKNPNELYQAARGDLRLAVRTAIDKRLAKLAPGIDLRLPTDP